MNSKKNLTYLSPYLKINRFLLGMLITQILVFMSFSITKSSKPKLSSNETTTTWHDPIEQTQVIKEEKPQPKVKKLIPENPFSKEPESKEDELIEDEKDKKETVVDLSGLTSVISGFVPNMENLDEEKILDMHLISELPEFPGGDEALMKFIKKHFNTPHIARQYEIRGVTYMTFVIDKDGNVSDILILKPERALGYGIEEEASRVISMMPQWKPGKQGSRSVSVRYVLPLHIKQ